jgi:hypothetical protein
MKKLVILGLALVAFATVKTVSADQYGCDGQYGGYGNGCPTNQSILIDKTVSKPGVITKGGDTSVEFVDNLSENDAHFSPEDFVYFQLKVKNTSDHAIDATVKDSLPSYLEPIDGPGAYDATNKIITINVGTLQANEEKVYTIKTKLATSAQLPSDKSIICLVNKAEAQATGAYDSDTAQLCVEKQVTGVTKVPSAGPEMGLALIISELGILGFGIGLKKKLS